MLSQDETMKRLLEYEDSRTTQKNFYTFDTSVLKSCGEDVRIFYDALFKRPELVRIASHCAIEGGFICTTKLSVGSYCHISYNVIVIGGKDASLTMGHFSHLAPGARIIAAGDAHQGEGLVSPVIPEPYGDRIDNRPVVVGHFATVGTGSVVMPGVTIGEGAVLGANSFTSKDLEPWTLYGGSPARPIKTRRKDKMLEFARRLGYDL